MELVLFQPEIPPNTGNVARLCAATDTMLHLVEPLGFWLEDRYLKRAGLDYWPLVRMRVWPNLPELLNSLTGRTASGVPERRVAALPKRRVVLTSARRGTAVHRFDFEPDDVLVMGRETAGLPDWVYGITPHVVRIPFHPDRRGRDGTPEVEGVRSLNMATAAGIVLYAALSRSGMLDVWEWEAECERENPEIPENRDSMERREQGTGGEG